MQFLALSANEDSASRNERRKMIFELVSKKQIVDQQRDGKMQPVVLEVGRF